MLSAEQFVLILSLGIAYICWGLAISLQAPLFPTEAEKKGATATEVSFFKNFISHLIIALNVCFLDEWPWAKLCDFWHQFLTQFLYRLNKILIGCWNCLNQSGDGLVSCSAVFWRNVTLVLKVILRYGRLKFFYFGPEKKAPRKACRWSHLKILNGVNT